MLHTGITRTRDNVLIYQARQIAIKLFLNPQKIELHVERQLGNGKTKKEIFKHVQKEEFCKKGYNYKYKNLPEQGFSSTAEDGVLYKWKVMTIRDNSTGKLAGYRIIRTTLLLPMLKSSHDKDEILFFAR